MNCSVHTVCWQANYRLRQELRYTVSMKRRLSILLVIIIALAIGGIWYAASHKTTPHTPATQSDKNSGGTKAVEDQDAQPSFNKEQYSLTDPTSIWLIANKKRPLQPKTYTPADLVVPNIQLRSNITSDERQVRQGTATALEQLSAAAKQENITLTLESGYRSYNFQVNLYNRYVNEQGQAVADTQSARAGHSEHQTGLAADVGGTTRPACNVEACFADTAEGKWVAANAYKYGFVIRYPEGKTPITGYTYEPWHLRYVGTDLSTEMHSEAILTLEEFFGLSAAPDYN
jgi:zinc D-Ala-D-Ala carboxypeptidase